MPEILPETPEEFIDFKCPYCQGTVSFAADLSGLAMQCPNCAETIVVPEPGSEVGKPLPIPITTARLTLRRIEERDGEDLVEMDTNEGDPYHRSSDSTVHREVMRWITEDSKRNLANPSEFGGNWMWLGIELLSANKLIGYLSVSYADEGHRQASLTIHLNPKYRKQGYGTEALRGVVKFCFEGIGLHRVTAGCDSDQVAVRRVMEKLGMRCEGESVQSTLRDGLWTDTVLYAMLESEYFSASNTQPPIQAVVI